MLLTAAPVKNWAKLAFVFVLNLIPCRSEYAHPYCDSIWFSFFCLGELLFDQRAYLERTPGHFRFLNKTFAWVWLYILQSQNSAESVNPGTLCDGGVLRAQHSPQQGRLLFIPVMSILLGISASLHTTCCAQQCGEARASRVVVSACQSQSQGSVSSHKSDKPYPDVVCLPSPHVLLPTIGCPSSITCCLSFPPVYHKQMLAGTYGDVIACFCVIYCSHIWKEIYYFRKKGLKKLYFQPHRRLFLCLCWSLGEESSQRW